MNVADLMKPRFKVVAMYPYCPWELNEILIPDEDEEMVNPATGFVASSKVLSLSDIQLYPHLFRKLAWYEERDVKDMPEYVKIATTNFSELRPNGTIHKVTYWNMNDGANLDDYWYDFTEVLPATQHDYETFKNGTK